ncbi:MAG: arsenate reductase ArsC [Actinomycetota bacterium]|nr:arsenate reductase ArsC [Actinomycetota bacterium]
MSATKSYLDDVPLEVRHLIGRAAERLHREFTGIFAAETIERFIADSWDRLGHGKVQTFAPLLVERFARERLRALGKVEGKVTSQVPGVVFLCTHNAGRSQMAAGWLQQLAGDRIEVFSGGSDPASEINPSAIQAMGEVGIDIANEYPKPWTDEVMRAADVIVTMGCGDACPIFPGKRYEDWELTDPEGKPVEQVRLIRDEIKRRVEILLPELLSRPL